MYSGHAMYMCFRVTCMFMCICNFWCVVILLCTAPQPPPVKKTPLPPPPPIPSSSALPIPPPPAPPIPSPPASRAKPPSADLLDDYERMGPAPTLPPKSAPKQNMTREEKVTKINIIFLWYTCSWLGYWKKICSRCIGCPRKKLHLAQLQIGQEAEAI